jgi:hypothetical protein
VLADSLALPAKVLGARNSLFWASNSLFREKDSLFRKEQGIFRTPFKPLRNFGSTSAKTALAGRNSQNSLLFSLFSGNPSITDRP